MGVSESLYTNPSDTKCNEAMGVVSMSEKDERQIPLCLGVEPSFRASYYVVFMTGACTNRYTNREAEDTSTMWYFAAA